MKSAHPTTIVIPVYGDLPSVEHGIQSVIDTVDLHANRLLIINDNGPDADEIERRILELIVGLEGATYSRNERNLGFVGTCNRAVEELDRTSNDILLLNSDAALTPGALDEMSAVLHLSEKHGVVAPRSNHATIATIPFRSREGVEASADRSRAVFDAVSPQLPRYTIAPVAHGFCFLVRRSLITIHGLFDEEFAPGYGEENDFCLRVNGYGFSSVVANHAYAFHEGERSFSSPASRVVQAEHEELLLARYPFYPSAVRHFIEDGIDAVDWFSDFLTSTDMPARVLIDLHHMSLVYDGSVKNALTFLAFLQRQRATGRTDGLEFVIAASQDAIDFFHLERFGFRVVANAELDELFDVGFSLAPVSTHGQVVRLDRICLRWVASHLDVIALRAMALLEEDFTRRQVVLDSLRYADRVVAISATTLEDTLDYFPELADDLPARTTIVHQGVGVATLTSDDEALEHHTPLSRRQAEVVAAGDYVLVLGNGFRHKQLLETTRALRGTHHSVIVFGSRDDDLGDNVVPIAGGLLTDADIDALYAGAAVIVYPSTYEGFGLPIAEAAQHGKPLVVFDTKVAHEVVSALGLDASTEFFSDFDVLPQVVDSVLAHPPRSSEAGSVRSMDDYNAAILEVIEVVLRQPVDVARLRRRRAYFRATRAYTEEISLREQSTRAVAELQAAHLSRRSHRLADAVVVRLAFLRPVARVVRRAMPRKS
jgi:GT2 family glycosyltransferase